MARSTRMVVAALAALLGPACTSPLGTGVGAPDGAGGSSSSGDGAAVGGLGGRDAGVAEALPPLPPLADDATVPGVAPLRRLTILEYRNSIRDLLGVMIPPAMAKARFVADQDADKSGFVRGRPVASGDHARAFLLTAEEVSAMVAARLAALLPCSVGLTAQAEQEACAVKFITEFGLRAYRRPLVPKEVEKLRALYRAQRSPDAAATFEEAIGDLVAAMLQAPEFLYHWELGPAAPIKDGALIRFNPYEVASRLSYLFWASTPDDQLLEAAAAGQLARPEQLAAQARRLLADDRARDAIGDFHGQWLETLGTEELAKDPMFESFTPALARRMAEESHQFVARVFFGAQADGKLETMLTSTSSSVDAALAQVYDVPAPMGTGLQPVMLAPAQRAGILTRAAFLSVHADASQAHPIRRGALVARRLLCLDVMDPVGVDIPVIGDPMPGVSNRERYEANGAMPCAAACHGTLVDPIGYAFEHYDAIGRYRTEDGGKPINARASFKLVSGAEFQYDNAVQLMGLLARSDDVRRCVTTQWLRYLLRRREVASEQPSQDALFQLFRVSGHDMRELMVGLTRTRTFTHRTLSPGEVTP